MNQILDSENVYIIINEEGNEVSEGGFYTCSDHAHSEAELLEIKNYKLKEYEIRFIGQGKIVYDSEKDEL